jgi:eukaryotic-like serine/threonine-protein kinase
VSHPTTLSDAAERLSAALADRYVIEREIGRGGMATVYLARDIRHERKVAIKVLDPELGAVLGADRFLAEIRVTAKLQHPNLLPLFDSGQAAGLLFYAMPYVEGESLRQRLDRERQLPVADALRIATDIAGALDYAHRHNVIHRDIKPENVLLHDGRAMVADFGIALAVQSAGAQRMTQTGLSLGTPQYMSPEQAMGERTIDARSDIYALGAVLYEMLTGDAPFTGSSVQAIVAKVLNERPTPVRTLRDSVSPSVEYAVLTALAKLPADRYATAKEFADALDAKASNDRAWSQPKPASQSGWRSPLVLTLAALLAIVGSIATWQAFTNRRAPSEVTVRFPIEISRYVSVGSAVGSGMAISPDGRTLAYIAGSTDASSQQVLVRSMDDPQSRPIPGTEAAQGVFFAPNGKSIGVWGNGRLSRVPLDGGAPLLIASGIGFTGASWGSSGRIVLSIHGRLMAFAETGGPMTPVAGDSAGRHEDYPVFLDDGQTVAVVSGLDGQTQVRDIVAVSLRTGQRTPTGVAGTFVLGVMDRVLLYVTSTRQLMGVRFNQRTLKAVGTPTQLMTIPGSATANQPAVAMSPAGTLAYAGGSSASELVRVDTRGVATPVTSEVRLYGNPRLSPDAKRIVFSIGEGNLSSVWLYDIAAKTMLHFSPDSASRPEWSGDGRRVIYRRTASPNIASAAARSALWWRPIDNSEPAAPVFVAGNGDLWEGVMTADGRGLVIQRDDASLGTGADVVYRSMTDSTFVEIAATAGTETQGRPSPDGQWVAYQAATPGGPSQVIVKSISGKGSETVVSQGFGTEPVWSRDRKHLYYRDGQQFVEVAYTASPEFRILSRTPLFADAYNYSSGPHANYDVYPDGSGFLALRPTERHRLIVAHNWRTELRKAMRF